MMFSKFELKLFEFLKKILLKYYYIKDYKPSNFKLFKDVSEIKSYSFPEDLYFETLNNKRDKLQSSIEENNILMAFEYYLGYVGSRMNNYLRNLDTYQDESSLIKKINIISSVIETFPLQTNLIVCRLMDSNSFEVFFNKFNMLENGFMSTSLNIINKKNLDSDSIYNSNNVVLFLKVPKFSRAIYLKNKGQRSEYELLLQRGTQIIIEKKYNVFSYIIVFASIKQFSPIQIKS